MGRGLGRIQKDILHILGKELQSEHGIKYRSYFKELNRYLQVEGWYDALSLTWQIVNGEDCFNKDHWEEVRNPSRKPTEAELQSVWRAIRCLEKRGLIESRKALGDIPYGNRGGCRCVKILRLKV